MTSGSGIVTDTYAYDAFGDGLSYVGNTTNPFLFNSQQFDQLTGNIAFAAARFAENGKIWTVILYVRSAAMGGTNLSRPLQELVDAGTIVLRSIDGGPLKQ